jgi:hypothetical protein
MLIAQDVLAQIFVLDALALIQLKEIQLRLVFAKLQHGIMEEHALVKQFFFF